MISAERARALEPGARFGAAERVAFYSDEGYAFPRPMIAELLRGARRHGATTRWGARVVELEERAGGVRVVLDGGDAVDGDAVVLCCGRWSGEAAAMVGAEIPILPAERGSVSVGLLVLTSALAEPVNRVLIADELMIRPDGAGRLLLHSDEHDRLVDPGSGEQRAIAEQVVAAAVAHLELPGRPSVEHATVGVRALTEDLLPAVGWLAGADRVYAAVTHSGVTLAPLLGELIAAEVLAGVDEPLLARFRPRPLCRPFHAGGGPDLVARDYETLAAGIRTSPSTPPGVFVRGERRPDRHPRALPSRCDVVVVGGGIAGLAAAWELRAHDVVLLEAERADRRQDPLRAAR